MKKPRLKKEVIEKIKFLRSQGHSVPEIAKELNVAKSTAFRHIQGVTILPEFLKTWFGKRGGSTRRKALEEAKALDEAKVLFKRLSHREKLLFLSALYWAEGSKKDFGLSNTDPALIKVFIELLKDAFGVKEQEFRISVRIYEDLDREKCLRFWSGITGIPIKEFVSVNVLQGKKNGKLAYGMCRIRVVKGGDLLKKIVGINKVVFANLSL